VLHSDKLRVRPYPQILDKSQKLKFYEGTNILNYSEVPVTKGILAYSIISGEAKSSTIVWIILGYDLVEYILQGTNSLAYFGATLTMKIFF
jgi:hypothetical protein